MGLFGKSKKNDVDVKMDEVTIQFHDECSRCKIVILKGNAGFRDQQHNFVCRNCYEKSDEFKIKNENEERLKEERSKLQLEIEEQQKKKEKREKFFSKFKIKKKEKVKEEKEPKTYENYNWHHNKSFERKKDTFIEDMHRSSRRSNPEGTRIDNVDQVRSQTGMPSQSANSMRWDHNEKIDSERTVRKRKNDE